jgi:hypothetical protein
MAPCRSSLIRAVIHTWKDTSATFISRKKAIYSNVVQGYLDRILTFHGLLHGPLALFSYMEQHGSQEKIGGHVRLVTGKMYDASASPEGPHYDNESCLPFEPDDADPRDAQHIHKFEIPKTYVNPTLTGPSARQSRKKGIPRIKCA